MRSPAGPRSSDGDWVVERIVPFEPGDLVKDGFVHFGFHDRRGRHYAIDHPGHVVGLIGPGGGLEWTASPRPVMAGVPNIAAELEFPMFVDSLPDGSPVVSNLGNARLYRIDLARMRAELLVDGRALGIADMGNAVVDDHGRIWVNEVTGCRIWAFDGRGGVVRVLGDGQPGFQAGPVDFDAVRFNWIYDIRRGPGDRLYVLDSRNFCLRAIDLREQRVTTIAGTGQAGAAFDGPALESMFGSDPGARYDGPISLAVDEAGTAFVGDRYNHVVRMIDPAAGTIRTIAGRPDADDGRRNDPAVRDPLRLNLPQISSMEYRAGRLFVPTDLSADRGDLAVLRRVGTGSSRAGGPAGESDR